MNEQNIEKGHYFFEHRQNTSTFIVFVGTAHKPKSSEIELLPRVLDRLPPLVSAATSRKRDVEISLEKTAFSTNFGFVGSS